MCSVYCVKQIRRGSLVRTLFLIKIILTSYFGKFFFFCLLGCVSRFGLTWKNTVVKKNLFFWEKKQKYIFPNFKSLINCYHSPNTFFFGNNYLFGLGLVIRTGVLTGVFFFFVKFFVSREKYTFWNFSGVLLTFTTTFFLKKHRKFWLSRLYQNLQKNHRKSKLILFCY